MTGSRETHNLLDRAVSIARDAVKAGAHAAEAYFSRATEREVRVRGGRPERVLEAGGTGCGLRVEIGFRQGFASTSDLSAEGRRTLVETALAIASRVPEAPDAALPAPAPSTSAALDLADPALEALDLERCVEMAAEMERAALDVSPRLSSGEGSTFSHARGEIAVASTLGVSASYAGTRCALRCAPVAAADGERQRLHWYEGRRFLADLPEPSRVGALAGERAARMLGARRLSTRRAPVVFDPMEAPAFWSSLLPALLGDAARRRASFLAGSLGAKVAGEGVTLVEDPLVPRAPGSRPFDGEGLMTSVVPIIERGILRNFLYDTRTARRAGACTTGSAVRTYLSPPSPGAHAPRLEAGTLAPDGILRAAGTGLYVTHLMGQGVNPVTGDYSRGANGWWFEGGEYAYPVHEVTLSGNLRDLLPGISLVGSDLVFRSAASSPTFLIEGLLVSGRGA